MLTSAAQVKTRTATRPAYRGFRASIVRAEQLSPSFRRITFGGPELADFGTAGLDQRVKVVLPHPERGFADFPTGEDWYYAWRQLPVVRRNVFRTYTVRAVRPELHEVDIDFVCHGDTGPASAWAIRAEAGDEVVLVGPDEQSEGRTLGIDWRPGDVDRMLLVADETAVPAASAIIEALPADARGAVFLEVPAGDDRLELRAPAGIRVEWIPRRAGQVHGDGLLPAVRGWLGLEGGPAVAGAPAASTAEPADEGVFWEVPEGTSADGPLYAWMAGEASAIKALRRMLVQEAGIDRRQVAFMGYWRRGKSELD
ncbi:siderophore-interacting protein [Agromyces archimandritae]|uniref:Siderophore-interacting protein n=1 Tax=Agromyces archimandritae TaxID=2781962 RepID=A0A975FPC4_9MICO|nr:siderophore-interacting protein [Agromyces archimandritae]QTX05188.1 siderophore-interacting protein [Agromyces archimandritae]